MGWPVFEGHLIFEVLRYLDTKINCLQCHGAELHLEVALGPVVGIAVGVGVHWYN